MNNITNLRTRKNQITKSLKKLIVFFLIVSLALPSLTEGAWAAANPPGAMLRDNQARAGQEPWKPDKYEDGSDAAVMSATGYCGNVIPTKFRGSVKGIHYTEYKNLEEGFGWSRKPGGNDNYADELIRVNARFDKKSNTVFWNIIVKGQSSGDLMGATKDLTNPYFTIVVSRGLEAPKNLYVSNGYQKMKEYPNDWQTQHSGDFRMYNVNKDSGYALYNGRRILGKTDQTKEFLQEKYRLPCTGDNKDKSMAYNIEKYNYYSKYAIIDHQSGFAEANTRMYSFTTELDDGEVTAQGELPNVASEFTEYMGWGTPRNDVDLSGKVWITVGVTSREFSSNKAKPHGTGNYNFSKIAVLDVVPNQDNLGLEPYYKEGSGKAEETVKLPVNLKNSKKFPEGTRFMLESDPKDEFYTNHNTGIITQTPANKKDRPISIDQYTGEVTVNIPKGAKGGQEIKDNVQVIYPDGSTHIVPLVVKVIEDKPNIKRGMYATNPVGSEKQLDKESFGDIYMGDDALKYTYQAGDTSKIIKSFTADNLPSGTTFGVGSQASSNNAPNIDHQRLERPLLLKADTKAKVGDFAIKFKAVNGSGKETTATNPGTIKTYLPTNNGTKIRIKKGTPKEKIPSPEAAIGIYYKKYKDRNVIRQEMKTGIDKTLIKNDKTGYLPDGTTYTWKRTPDTDTVGQGRLNYAIVKYTDKSGKEIVDEVPVYVDVYDTDDVIAYTPNDKNKPTNDKDTNVPKKDSKKEDVDVNDYNLVAFRTENTTKGTLTKDNEKNKDVISVLVKKNKSTLKTFDSIKPTVNAATDYTFWFWDKDPADKKQAVADKDAYADKDIYTAYFIKSGDEIKEVDKNIPLPNGFHKVTIAKGDGIENNQLFGKTYAVKEGEKLGKDKFPNLKAQASYKEPKWNVDNPWDQTMGKADVTYTATAAQKTIAEKIEVLGGIEGKDLAVWVGDTLNADFWKKGVVAKSTDTINKAAVEATIQATNQVEDVTKPARTTNAEVLNPTAGKLKITFADGSSLEVTQKLYVYAKKTTKPTDPKQPTPKDAVVVAYNKGDGVKELQGTGKTLVKSGETLANADFPRAALKEGHKDLTWSGQTAGNPKDYKVTAQNKVFTAKATKIEYTTDKIVPWIPADPKNPENDKPTTGKDGKEIPANYVTVKFTAQKEAGKALGKVTVGAKTGEEVLAKVKPNTDLSKKTDITATGNNGYGFTKWDPALTTIKENSVKEFTAKFIKDGSEVGKNDPIPQGWFRVTLTQDNTIQTKTVTEKYYAVAPKDDAKGQTGKLSKDKFPSLTGKEATNYKNPGWYKDADQTATAKPWEVEITADTTFTAKATDKTLKEKIEALGGLDPADIKVWVGDKIDWSKAVKAKKSENEDKVNALLKGATVTDLGENGTLEQPKTARTSSVENLHYKIGNPPDGEKGNIKVKFTDNSELVVNGQTLYVSDKVTPADNTNAPADAIGVQLKLGEGVKVEDKNPLTQEVIKVTNGNKETPVLYKSYKAKPGTDLSTYIHPRIHNTIFSLINAVPEKGYINPVWNPEDKIVTTKNNVFTATATKIEYTADDVVPYLPGENEPNKGSDGKPIPANYVTVKFTAQKEAGKALGKVTVGEKTGEEVLAKIKPNTDLTGKATATAKKGYGFTVWSPELGVAQAGKEYTAKFIKSGSEVGKNDPIPQGWFRVTVKQDTTSIAENTVTEKTYAVAPNDKLAADKFPSLENKAKDGYENPAWYVDGTKVDKPSYKAITADTIFTAKANPKTTTEQTAKPNITAPKAGDRTISGTGIVGAKVSITKEDKKGGKGSPIARDVIVGNDGKWTANVPDGVNLEEGDTILATQKENGKGESDQAQAKVKGKEDTTADPVIPFEPKNPEKPGDKDDKNIPTVNPEDKKPIKRDEYVVVGFKVDPKDSGTLTLGELKNKAVISALVKKDTKWADFTMPTTNDGNDYVFWHWDTAPADKVADGQVRVATFIKSGDEINPNDNNPLPKDFHKVTVTKGTGIADNALFGKSYAVKKGETLAHDKFPTLKVTDETQFKNPSWNVGNPWTVPVADKDLIFTANAVNAVFDKNNVTGMEVKTQPDLDYVEGNATKGKLDLSKLVVTLTDKNGNTQDVPFDKLGDYGITANPGNGTDMTVDGNNGKPVVLTKGDLTANTDNLVVTKDNTTEEKSEKPIIDRPTEGDDKITGEGKPGANIVVKDKDGNKIGEAEVNDKGKWEVPVPKDKPLKENDKITVEQTEEGKKPNTAETTVKGKKTPTPPTPSRPSRPSTPDRVHGKDRVETAIDISKKYFGKANTVIVVDRKDFPDAMTASVLSKLLKAPILLTDTNKLDPRVAAEIQRLGAKDAIVVGGNKSVSEAVKKELAKFDKDTVERIYGRDRYETSAQVARRVVGITGKLGHAVVASGEVFADALAVAPYASREGYPILLVRANNLPKSVKDAITKLAINKVTIAGGYITVNKSLEASLPTVAERLSGKTRYETAIDIANKKYNSSKEIFLANGEQWMDALVIGPVGGMLDMPILLTRANSAPQSLKDYIAKSRIQKITAIGGTSMVSEKVLNELSK